MNNAETSISERLQALGYTHKRTPNADNTGKHTVTEISSGKEVGQFTAHEAADFCTEREAE